MNDTTGQLAGVGALLSAALVSACCVGPVVVAVLGLSGVGLAVGLVKYRPVFLGTTAVLLGLAFYLTYRTQKVDCADGSCAWRSGRRSMKITLWVIAALAVGLVTFPFWATEQATTQEVSSANTTMQTVRLRIPGMDCPACIWGIERTLKRVPGVLSVFVNFKQQEAIVQTQAGQVPAQTLADAVNVFDPAYKAAIHN